MLGAVALVSFALCGASPRFRRLGAFGFRFAGVSGIGLKVLTVF